MRVFVLTGAGVSAESGLGTFRDKDGLWSRFDPMKLATPEAFARTPDTVLEFYNLRRRGLIAAVPMPRTARWPGSRRGSPGAAARSSLHPERRRPARAGGLTRGRTCTASS